MKLYATLMASCALAVAGASAQADCAEDLARLTGEAMEPMNGTAEASAGAGASDTAGTAMEAGAGATAGHDGIAKDGSLAPLETAGTDPTQRAMSGQDAAAQQDGAPTAAETAEAAGSPAPTGTDDSAGGAMTGTEVAGADAQADAEMAEDGSDEAAQADATGPASTEDTADSVADATGSISLETAPIDMGSDGAGTQAGGSDMAAGTAPDMTSAEAGAATDTAASPDM
ncbi:MAG: hypothetical protein LPJ95_02450, partial [Paracoccaceae bacterium]|nr:hypothetical protein [Paracoccaceae bacterium]